MSNRKKSELVHGDLGSGSGRSASRTRAGHGRMLFGARGARLSLGCALGAVLLCIACRSGERSDSKAAATTAPPAGSSEKSAPTAAPRAASSVGPTEPTPKASGSNTLSEGMGDGVRKEASPAAPVSPKDPEIRLLEVGKPPHRALRFRPSAGTTETVSTTTRLGIEMQGLGAPGSMQRMPTTRVDSKTKIVELKSDGDIRYEFEIAGMEVLGDSTLPAEVLSALKTSLEPLRGLTGRGVATRRGLVREVKLDSPPGSDPQLRQMLGGVERALRQMISPLPEEPVGVGARWRHATTIEEQGVTLSQTATYTLVSLDGEQAKVTFAIEQDAPKQSLKGAGLPDGTGVLSLTGKGSGETQFDLGRLTPTRASLELASQGDVSVSGQIVTTKTQTSMLMEGK